MNSRRCQPTELRSGSDDPVGGESPATVARSYDETAAMHQSVCDPARAEGLPCKTRSGKRSRDAIVQIGVHHSPGVPGGNQRE